MEILHSEIERILLNESINKSLMANLVQGIIRHKNHMYLLDRRETNLYDESNILIYVFYDGRSLDEQSQDDVFNYLYEEIQEEIEILFSTKEIPQEKQIELLENMISNLKLKP